MTKHDEIQTIKKFVANLPENTYLRSALEPFVSEFEHGVYSDIVPSLRESWNARIEAQREAAEARRAIDALKIEHKKLQEEVGHQIRRLERANDSLRDISSTIDIANRAADRAAAAARVLLS